MDHDEYSELRMMVSDLTKAFHEFKDIVFDKVGKIDGRVSIIEARCLEKYANKKDSWDFFYKAIMIIIAGLTVANFIKGWL